MPLKVDNKALLAAGLTLMEQSGRQLRKQQTNSRAMIYSLRDGATVRVRTCNDHILVVVAETPASGAKLNIEGTDHLLIIMPETPRTDGNVVAYFLPTNVAILAARQAHKEWLASNPATKGNNRTWNIWFEEHETRSGGFARKWAKYRLPGAISTAARGSIAQESAGLESKSLGSVIANARRQIAEAAGVPIESVKISVALD